jgi:CDP-glycerol glycerophosphotransferase
MTGLATRLTRRASATVLQRWQRPSPDRVVYNSFNGRFSDSPRAIYEQLVEGDRKRSHTWVADQPPSGFPDGIKPVAQYSVPFLREVGRAKFVVSNVAMPRNLHKRPSQVYLQTWHGTPLKRIGFDNEQWATNPGGFRDVARDSSRWDYLISQNAFSSEIFRRAFRFDGEILETGYPRNDILSSSEADGVRARVREELGIGSWQTVVLYAPTWRDNLTDEHGGLGFSMQLDLARLASELGEDHVFLIRTHHAVSTRLKGLGGSARDVSQHPDIRELYLAADVLITDYSSTMFDFAVTGKPIIYFVYDLAAYRDEIRGFYFELEDEAPGPLCSTNDDVLAILRDVSGLIASYAEPYRAFRERFCSLEDGRAAARVIDRVFTGSG